jgi:hypothetical protein
MAEVGVSWCTVTGEEAVGTTDSRTLPLSRLVPLQMCHPTPECHSWSARSLWLSPPGGGRREFGQREALWLAAAVGDIWGPGGDRPGFRGRAGRAGA